MATFTGTVSYSINGSVIDLADNDFRIIEQNGTFFQWGTIDITDMYPSANFTFGFELTATEDPGEVVIPFVISFYDTETRFNFTFNTNATQTAFSVIMENDVEGTTQTYSLFSGNKPSLYPANGTKILIRLLNGFLWVKVGTTFWIEKLDIQAHPLHLEGGIIQFSLTNTTVLVSHRIKNIYFEPILCIHDQTYFAKGIFPEKYENLDIGDVEPFSYVDGNVGLGTTTPQQKFDVAGNINAYEYYKNGEIYSLNPDDLVVDYPVGLLLCDYRGNTYNNDPDWRKCGEIVNRADYKKLANEIGIPVSQTTFKLPCPRLKQEWIEDAPLWLKYGNDACYMAGNVGIGTTLTENIKLVVNGKIRGQSGIHIGDDVAPSQISVGGMFEHLLCSLELQNPNHLNVDDCALLVGNGSINHNKIGISLAIGGGSYGLVCVKDELEKYRLAFLDNFYPRPNNITTTVETLTVLSSLDGGNVGIGTTDPSQKLEVNGIAKATSVLTDVVQLTPIATPANEGEFRYLGADGFRGGIPDHNMVIPLTSFYRLRTNRAFSNISTAQQIFDVNPVLYAGYTYYFKIILSKTRTATNTTGNSHTINFDLAGTCVASSVRWYGLCNRYSSTNSPTTNYVWQGSRNELVIGASFSLLTEYTTLSVEGVIEVSQTGTLIPRLRYSAIPVSGAVGYSDTIFPNALFTYQVLGSSTVSTLAGEWV